MLSTIHAFATNTPSTFSSPAVFYFCQRMKRCSINFLLLASLTGISLGVIMQLASLVIQGQRRNLIALSKKFAKEDQEETESNDDDDDATENENETESSTSTSTTDSILEQYSQYLATWKKPWILKVVDECAKPHRNPNEFGENVFDELLLNFAYFSSSSPTNSILANHNNNNNNVKSTRESNKEHEHQHNIYGNDSKSYLTLTSTMKNPSSRSKLIFSTVAKYFASRFAARVLWGLMLMGIEKAFSRIILLSSTTSSIANENPYFPFSKGFAEGILQLSSIGIDSKSEDSSYLFSALLEFSLHIDFCLYGISSKRGRWLFIPSSFILQCFNVAGAPCLSMGSLTSVASTRELLGKTSPVSLNSSSAGFVDVMLYHLVHTLLNEDIFTFATRFVDVFLESYENLMPKIGDAGKENNNAARTKIDEDNKSKLIQQQDSQKENKDNNHYLFDEEGNVLASITPNQNQAKNDKKQEKPSLDLVITSPSVSLSTRARFQNFLRSLSQTAVQIFKKDVPSRVRQLTLVAVGTFVLRKVIGEKRISWYTCSVISYFLVY